MPRKPHFSHAACGAGPPRRRQSCRSQSKHAAIRAPRNCRYALPACALRGSQVAVAVTFLPPSAQRRGPCARLRWRRPVVGRRDSAISRRTRLRSLGQGRRSARVDDRAPPCTCRYASTTVSRAGVSSSSLGGRHGCKDGGDFDRVVTVNLEAVRGQPGLNPIAGPGGDVGRGSDWPVRCAVGSWSLIAQPP
jgi:hypothetical protein